MTFCGELDSKHASELQVLPPLLLLLLLLLMPPRSSSAALPTSAVMSMVPPSELPCTRPSGFVF
jgi:hypothetical protein